MKHIAKLKEDMHHVYIWVQKDPAQTWTPLQFIVTNDIVHKIVKAWPMAWWGPATVERDEAAIQKQKGAAKCTAQQKKNEQYVVEFKAAWEAKLTATDKIVPGVQTPSKDKGTQKEIAQLATMGTPLKHSATPERMKAQKKEKASEPNSEVSTLTEGNLNEIENIVHEATQEVVDEAMLEHHIVFGYLWR